MESGEQSSRDTPLVIGLPSQSSTVQPTAQAFILRHNRVGSIYSPRSALSPAIFARR